MIFNYDSTPLIWFQFQLFEQFKDQILHGCFTSLYGKSKRPFEGLNVGKGLGDEDQTVDENKALITRSFQMRMKTQEKPVILVGMNQAHTDKILSIRTERDVKIANEETFDALITNVPHLILMSKHADCQPILLFDPENNLIAAIHAGWKGIAQQITTKTIQRMVKEWGTNPSQIFAAIGPSIGPEEYEFRGWEKELPAFLHSYIDITNDKLNLWQASLDELKACGVPREQMECASISTYTLPTLFYSFRRDNVTGRNATCICLRG